MGGRFARGGRLLAFGEGVAAADAAHVVVEFAHPVIVGKRALRLADPATLQLFAEPDDIALGIGNGPRVAEALATAASAGLLTIALVGGDGGAVGRVGVDHLLAVPSDDPRIVREGHVTTYHVLWELVHVFLEAKVV
jgi:D-sedoheptulose 7-phosphate isomerase